MYAADPLPANCTGTATITCTFEYNGTDGSDGSVQSFTVPAKVKEVRIEAWGAQGAGTEGGRGGQTGTTLAVEAGTVFEIRVGGQPQQGAGGGYNGGGHSERFGGGGASDVRPAGGDLASRIVTAGGGGGQAVSIFASTPSFFFGGFGGGNAGGTPCVGTLCGRGASQTEGGAGGSGGNQGCSPQPGTFGAGGAAGIGCGSGGGGGWYGGGAADYLVVTPGEDEIFDSGGGGSGHVAAGTDHINLQGMRVGHGLVTISFTPKPPLPPTGDIVCVLSGGTITFAKPLTLSPNPKLVTMKVKATGAMCENLSVVGGKAPITDVTVTGRVRFGPGAWCDNLPLASKPARFRVRWKGPNPKNKLIAVGASRTSLTGLQFPSFTEFELDLAAVTNAKKPFANQPLHVSITVAEDEATQRAACESADGLKTLHISGGTVASN